MSHLTYIKADSEDCEMLSKIAKHSKQNWGYPIDRMLLWNDDLTLTSDYISQNHVYKIYDQSQLIGFYSIIDGEIPEVDHLWLTPENQRKGYGSSVFAQIRKTIQQLGKPVFQLIAEPHAKGFYDKMNGIAKSRFESKIPGRFLEIYEFNTSPN
ncbi:GNAT family N-acetyltransferase [Flavobacterium sp.]|uniref:GNAT family N-acetyltransferase n=1 Tax=Flavobacterium sp. TaxID=239 RepID=UPI0011F5BDAC|nr:GNAT family N-acetyltransferase [Flavobacterium sp.]RZJ70563.1 MAG: N-acetyltransferase [Flavobacterium sp.]